MEKFKSFVVLTIFLGLVYVNGLDKDRTKQMEKQKKQFSSDLNEFDDTSPTPVFSQDEYDSRITC